VTVSLFVPDGHVPPAGARVVGPASCAGAAGTLVESELVSIRGRVEVVALDDGRTALAPVAMGERWNHSSLAVTDIDTATGFYSALLGFEIEFTERAMGAQIDSIAGVPGLTCDLAQLRSPLTGHTLELIAFHPPAGAPEGHAPLRPGEGHAAFAVIDLDAALVEVERLGGRMLGEVTQFEEGRSAYCQEPGGSYIELIEPVVRAGPGRA
jgi:predicted enzyme related to lactoylglutathione lyase